MRPNSSDAMAAYPGRKWTVRERSWPNGRIYYVIGIGPKYGVTLAGKSGGESKYYDKSQAQSIADELNAPNTATDDPLIEAQ